jgi:hypothetical protein
MFKIFLENFFGLVFESGFLNLGHPIRSHVATSKEYGGQRQKQGERNY